MRSRLRPLALTLSFAALACADEPQVHVEARVGQIPESGADPQAAARILREMWAEPEHDVVDDPTTFVAQAPENVAAFDALVETIRVGASDEVDAAARNLAAAHPRVWPRVKELLLAERARPKGEYRSVLAVIGGDVPNRYGHFALHWKKAHGYKVKVSEDWFEDLLAMPSARVSPGLREVYRDCVLTAALLRAAPAIGAQDEELSADVTETLLDAAYVHAGTFRDEVSRSMVALGNPAIPTLMLASVPPEDADEESDPYRRAQFARYSLDKMNRLLPMKAVESVAHHPRLLRDTLAAFALTKDPEAAGVLLEHVDAPDPAVRKAARDAVLAYVVGPAPSRARRTLRLLGGGTTTRRAHLTYRGMIAVALRDHLGTAAPQLVEEPCTLRLPGNLIDPECERQPERHARAYFEHLDQQRRARTEAAIAAALSSEDLDRAVADLDVLLDEVPRGEQAVPIAQRYAEAAERARSEGDAGLAARLQRKSSIVLASVDLQASSRARAQALLDEASVEGLEPSGRDMLLSAALELDPSAPELVTALAGARAEGGAEYQPNSGPLWRGLTLLFLGLGALAVLGTQLRQRRLG